MGNANHRVIELTIKLKYDWNNVSRNDMRRIYRAIDRWAKVGKFGGKVIAFLVVTTETSQQMLDRLRSELDDISVVEDFMCQTAGSDGVGMHGNMCPFQTRVEAAWEEARKRNYPKKVQDPRTRNIWLDHGVDYLNRNAAIKMGLRPRRKGKGE